MRDVPCQRMQCDEIWSLLLRQGQERGPREGSPGDAGDVWTWTALDADFKLIVSWLVGGRDAGYAIEFMDDLRSA